MEVKFYIHFHDIQIQFQEFFYSDLRFSIPTPRKSIECNIYGLECERIQALEVNFLENSTFEKFDLSKKTFVQKRIKPTSINKLIYVC
jgi:hypothetical protein